MKYTFAFGCVLASLAIASCAPVPKPLPEAKPPVQRERIAYLNKTAGEPDTCTTGADCTAKMARALAWVYKNSSYQVVVNTPTEIKTSGPVDPTTDSAFDITLVPAETGSSYIHFDSSCGKAPFCSPTSLELRSGFHNYVMYGN